LTIRNSRMRIHPASACGCFICCLPVLSFSSSEHRWAPFPFARARCYAPVSTGTDRFPERIPQIAKIVPAGDYPPVTYSAFALGIDVAASICAQDLTAERSPRIVGYRERAGLRLCAPRPPPGDGDGPGAVSVCHRSRGNGDHLRGRSPWPGTLPRETGNRTNA